MTAGGSYIFSILFSIFFGAIVVVVFADVAKNASVWRIYVDRGVNIGCGAYDRSMN